MKKLLIIFLAFFCNSLFAQEPPFTLLINLDNFSEKEEIASYTFKGRLPIDPAEILYSGLKKIYENNELFRSMDIRETNAGKNYYYLTFPPSEIGYLIFVKIDNHRSNETMNIWIRLPREMGYYDVLNIDNLVFKQGTFFFDMLDRSSKFSVALNEKDNLSINGETFDLEIEQDILDIHHVKEKELKNILINNNTATSKRITLVGDNLSNYEILTISNQRLISEKIGLSDYEDKHGHAEALLLIESDCYYSFPIYNERDILVNNEIIIVKIVEKASHKKMYIAIKIFKNNKELQLNEITLKNFQFQEGYYYLDMEEAKENKNKDNKHFIKLFDVKNISDKQIQKNHFDQIYSNN